MKKPDSLRALLLRAVPDLAAAPESLSLFVDQGSVAARTNAAGSLSYEYRYTLNIVVQDYAGDRNAVMVPLLAWVAQAQPDLLGSPAAEPIAFEAELLDGDLCDLSVTLDLTERVLVEALADGGYAARHLDEAPTADLFPGLCGTKLWQLALGGEVVAQTSDPAFGG